MKLLKYSLFSIYQIVSIRTLPNLILCENYKTTILYFDTKVKWIALLSPYYTHLSGFNSNQVHSMVELNIG